ncbi:MAG: hypothetical protein IT208_08425 [Chthonomonadales bacterium]|nr:hypothetical protein [Chthonomonadales bacterium]
MTAVTEPNVVEALALQFASDLVHRAMLRAGAPVKASEAARLVGRPEMDLRLARVVLASQPGRFSSTDRKWTVWTRDGDATHTLQRNLDEVLESAGIPLAPAVIARALSAIYARPAEVYEPILERMLRDRDLYFATKAGEYGPGRWLLETTNPTEEDVLFDNYLTAQQVAPFLEGAEGLSAADLDAQIAFLDRVDAAVPSKALQFLLWRSDGDDFDPATWLARLFADGRATLLSTGEWIGPAVAARLLAHFPALAQREIEETAEAAPTEAVEPLVINDDELNQLVEFVLANETTSRADRMLESIFEVTPGEPTYEQDRATIVEALRTESRVLWMGADRFLPPGAIPDYVFSVPEVLRYTETAYLDAEGNEVDILLDEDGLSGGLPTEVHDPLAMDVLDEDPPAGATANPPVTVRCVLKFHHKGIGTLPLCQLPPGFFPTDSRVLQADVVLPNGHTLEVWVNNDTRLVYGLLDWYLTLPVDSGAVFYLERQAPDRYVLTYGEETEAALFVSRNRVNELLEIGQRAEAEELPTFEVLREIMEHYRKGLEYITALTEVNIARRSTRTMVASLLSAYHCFFQRGRAWVYDAKKLSQGFDKSKRKYLKR